MNHIYFGDNLSILRDLPSESIDLIYIDPPFNTGKTQALTSLKTVRSESGDRKGFKGNSYESFDLGTKSYKDSFESSKYYIEDFIRPRIEEAYRLLKPYGSLYFHIDYREVHYCRILLDSIFGRDSFINEIIWAYDFGGRPRSRWPAKHDNILFYAKDPKNFIFNTSEVDRIPYMAPGLVGPEKAKRKKLPTDTWWFSYVGDKRQTDTWWHTIVGTSSKERLGYPTQKPRGVIDRIIKVSSLPDQTVMDFFAGSGTVGESCLVLNRAFVLIDNNKEALEVMARRFDGYENISWDYFDPSPYQTGTRHILADPKYSEEERARTYSPDFEMLVATANYIQKDLEKKSEQWKDSPFEWVLLLPARKKGKLAEHLVASWCASNGIYSQRPKSTSSVSLMMNNCTVAIKFSTLWTNGTYRFQQIREKGYDFVICFGISPHAAHCWFFSREHILNNATEQHKGAKGSEYWTTINPNKPPEWAKDSGGTLEQALNELKRLLKLR